MSAPFMLTARRESSAGRSIVYLFMSARKSRSECLSGAHLIGLKYCRCQIYNADV